MPARRTIGVDMGSSRLRAGVIDADLSVHRRAQRSVAGLGRAGTVAAVVAAVQEAGELTGVDAVGLALVEDDAVLADAVSERVGLPVTTGAVGALAALAEHRAGAARGAADALVLTVGDRVCGGLVADGELTGEVDFGEGAGVRVSELAHDGDPNARRALEALADRVAELAAELRPEVVVIGASEPLFGALRDRLSARVLPAFFGADATMVGAAALAQEAARPTEGPGS